MIVNWEGDHILICDSSVVVGVNIVLCNSSLKKPVSDFPT